MSNTDLSAPCPICDAVVTLASGIVVSEIVNCRECGSDIEVRGLSPLQLAEAPMEEEDWGE
jgi:alpha-aminoadipate carrier protein LysW